MSKEPSKFTYRSSIAVSIIWGLMLFAFLFEKDWYKAMMAFCLSTQALELYGFQYKAYLERKP
jgi:hypothetical protein